MWSVRQVVWVSFVRGFDRLLQVHWRIDVGDRLRSAAVAAPPKSGRATAQDPAPGLGAVGAALESAGYPAHPTMNNASNAVAGLMKRQRTGSLAANCGHEDLVVQAAEAAADLGAAARGPDQTVHKG